MDELYKSFRTKLPFIGDMLFSILVFPFAFSFLENLFLLIQNPSDSDVLFWLCALYGSLALVHLFRAFRLREKGGYAFAAHLIYSAAFAVCTVLAGILGYTRTVQYVLEAVFWSIMIAERIRVILCNRRIWSIIFNVILILAFILICLSSIATIPLLLTSVAAAAFSFISIVAAIFSGLRLAILKDIVRKTYAAEIILGMLLLIVTFSYVLVYTDPAISTFWDGLWYCFAVVTTIGFGDLAATSIIGRIITVILGIYGIVVVALITSVIVNFYGEMKKVDAAQAASQDTPDSGQGS